MPDYHWLRQSLINPIYTVWKYTMRTARQRRNIGGVTGDKTTALKPSRRKLPTWPPPPANWPAKKPVEVKFLLPSNTRFPNPNNTKQRKSAALMVGWEKKFGIKTARPARNLRELKEKRNRVRTDARYNRYASMCYHSLIACLLLVAGPVAIYSSRCRYWRRWHRWRGWDAGTFWTYLPRICIRHTFALMPREKIHLCGTKYLTVRMNNNPCQLSKILENVEGEDLDGDGQVTEQEIIETRVRKGKEIFARTFLKENVSRCSPNVILSIILCHVRHHTQWN